MSDHYMPQERLRVFVSSAQRNENGFAWWPVRRAIRDRLQKCPYLNPFIIEDVARSSPSAQTYERQVARSDIVVTLIKGDVRPGTAAEYAIARRYNKPILLYSCEVIRPLCPLICSSGKYRETIVAPIDTLKLSTIWRTRSSMMSWRILSHSTRTNTLSSPCQNR